MRLLIITQVVDTGDSYLGFFARWIEEFAKHAERVEVICLKEGKHSLPGNVRVHSLGKEHGASHITYVFNFYRYIWSLRHDYDAVFVHMNPEYVVLGGIVWKALHKRIALWYMHKTVNLMLRLAEHGADIVFTGSKESFRLPSRKVRVMGHGIDTEFFMPDPRVQRGDWYLSVGRLMPSKDHKRAMVEARDDGRRLRIAGEGPQREELESYARSLGAQVEFLGGLSQAALRDEYRKAMLLIHTSKTGSLDKVVLEALACGLPVHTHDPALKAIENEGPQYVREHHSLHKLIPAILSAIQTV